MLFCNYLHDNDSYCYAHNTVIEHRLLVSVIGLIMHLHVYTFSCKYDRNIIIHINHIN